MNGAQAEGCSPVASAFAAGHDVCRPVKPDTIAKSLAIGNPADGPYALDLARRTGGSVDAVSDEEIRAGIALLAETTGIFTETAGGVTTAVLAKLAARGDIDPDERVVLVITGEGLKTLDAVRGHVRDAHDRARRVEAFEAGVPEAVDGLMAVLVKIPTQLRAAAGGEAEAQVDGATVQEVLDGLFDALRRAARADLRRGRLAAALRQRVPRRRRHPLPGRPADAGRRRRRADDPAGGRGRLTRAAASLLTARRVARRAWPRQRGVEPLKPTVETSPAAHIAPIVSARMRRGREPARKCWVCSHVLKPVAAEAAAIAQPTHMPLEDSAQPAAAAHALGPRSAQPPGACAAPRRGRRRRRARRAPRSARARARGRSRAGPGAPRSRARRAGTASRTGRA